MKDSVEQYHKAVAELTAPGAPFEIEQQTINGIDYHLFKNAPATLRDFLERGREHGERTFLVYEGEEWSFDTFFDHADKIAYQLITRHDIAKGDRVAIAMRNSPEWMAAYVGIVSAGAIVVPLNSWGKREELEFVLKDSGAKVVFCDQARLDYIGADLQDMNLSAIAVRTDTDANLPDRAITFERFLEGAEADRSVVPECNSEDPAMIMYTSGTTGKPKGALSNNRNIVQALLAFEQAGMASAMANPDTVQTMMSAGHEPTSLLAVPLFHVSGCHSQFMLSLAGGRRMVLMYRWDVEKALALVEKYRITTLAGAPKMVLDVLEHPDFDKFDTSSLCIISGGGAASPPKYASLVYEKLGNPYPGVGYGMTETNAICAAATGVAVKYKPKSSGLISPIVDVITLDEEGKELPAGETGEIAIRSPTVVTGYWRRPDETAQAIVDGWMHSGDIGYVDDERFIYILDRAKDIIIRGGENIAAAEVEGCLHHHPAVYDVAAIGVPHERLGEELGVVVVLKPGADASEDELRAHVADHLAGFKVPTHIWKRTEDFPRNATGKPLKKDIKAMYLAAS